SGDPLSAPARARANLATSMSLLERARARDQAAWGRLFYLYKPMGLYWCGRAGVHEDNAEDVVQEEFKAVAGGLDGFRRERRGDTFRGWLRGITRNLVLLHFRRGRRHVPAAGGSEAQHQLEQLAGPGPEADDAPEEISGLYRRALELVRDE